MTAELQPALACNMSLARVTGAAVVSGFVPRQAPCARHSLASRGLLWPNRLGQASASFGGWRPSVSVEEQQIADHAAAPRRLACPLALRGLAWRLRHIPVMWVPF